MKDSTLSVVGPGFKMLTGVYKTAETVGEVPDVIAALGLSLDQVNDAFKRAKRAQYLAQLELGTDPDTKIAATAAFLVTQGFDAEQAKTIAETKRENYEKSSGLPAGLVARLDKNGNQVISARRGPKAKTT